MKHSPGAMLLVALALLPVYLLAGCGGGDGEVIVTGLSASELQQLMQEEQPLSVVDIREASAYEAGHIPGSINLPAANVATWAKTLDKDTPVCCICACSGATGEAYRIGVQLVGLGYTQVYQLLGGIQTWPYGFEWSLPVTDVESATLQTMMNDGEPLLIVDVRTPAEYASGHLAGSVNLPLDDLNTWAPTLTPTQRLCCVCAVGGRSRSAAAMLVARGFSQVFNLLGGLAQWSGQLEQ